MAEKKIRNIEIEPAENGGHTVTHRFKEQPTHSRKGGMSMGYIEPEQHVFGPGDDEKMLGHVAKHLGLKTGKVVDKDGDGE